MAESVMRIAGESKKSLPKKIGFTVEVLQRLTCPDGKDRVSVYDAKTPGLMFRVTSRGAKGFYLYRKVNGLPQKMKLGGFPDISIDQARKLCALNTASIAEGKDPMEERRAMRRSMPLQELFDRYEKDHMSLRCTPRTADVAKSLFDTCFEDWTARKLSTIRDQNIRDKHAELGRARGHVTANRAMQLLRRMYGWARIEPNPVRKGVVDFFPENSRERFLEPAEMKAFIEAVNGEENQSIKDFVLLALYTGARRSNVQSMRWDEINMLAKTWTIPAEKAKAKAPIRIHLSEHAIKIIETRQNNESEWVFPSHGKTGHMVEPKTGWARILKTANITDLHVHDLRRTLGSWQAAAGASLLTIGKSLGHLDTASTAVYSRLQLDDVRKSVDVAVAAMVAKAEEKDKSVKTATKAKGKRKGKSQKVMEHVG
ncbi:MAG TPA: tyrosine-type recombinase/integrase [Tepidisphaeraceae bacterium]|jgi:integrase